MRLCIVLKIKLGANTWTLQIGTQEKADTELVSLSGYVLVFGVSLAVGVGK